MIRAVLALDAAQPDLFALDAAMQRGELLLAGELSGQFGSTSSPAEDHSLSLRRAGLAYLANRYADASTWLSRIAASDKGQSHIHGVRHFLLSLIAIDQRQESVAKAELQAADAFWAHNPESLLYSRLADTLLQHYLNRYNEAEQALIALASSFDRADHAWGYWQTRRVLGLVYYERTNYKEALKMLAETRSAYAELGDRYETARCDKAIASTHRRLENQAEALAHIESAITYFDSQQLAIPQARCLTTLGGIQFYFNTQEQALFSFQAAASKLEHTGLQLELAHAIANIGLCYYWLGHNRLALQAYRQATALANEISSPDAQAQFARYMAGVFWNNGQPQEALQSIQKAAALWQEIGALMQAAVCWRVEAEYLLEGGDFAGAENLLARSSKTLLQYGRPTQAALASIILARSRIGQGDTEAARELLHTCEEILRRHERPHQAAPANILLGQLYLKQGAQERAESQFQLALTSAPPERIAEAWRAYLGLAEIAETNQDWQKAGDCLQQATRQLSKLRRGRLSLQAAANLVRDNLPVYDRAIALALQREMPELALAVLEDHKALQLSQQLQQSRLRDTENLSRFIPATLPISAGAVQTDAARLDELQAAIRRAHELEDWRSMAMLEAQYQQLAERFASANAPYASLFEPPALDLSVLKSSLDKRHGPGRWACISYGWLGDSPTNLHRFWLDSQRLLSAPIPLSTLDRHLLTLACHPELSYRRRFLAWDGDANNASQPKEWTHVQNLLLPSDWQEHISVVDTLYILPSGALASFPFAALAIDSDFLGLSKSLSQAPSLPFLQTLLRVTQDSASDRYRALAEMHGLVFGIPTYPDPDRHSPLPSTNREALDLKRRLSPASKTLIADSATVDSLKKLDENRTLSQFEILHFATHALLHPYHTHLCHIALFESGLYVTDILNLRFDARLITLAACDTAVGHMYAGDEQMGLPHAFLVAGADTILASLWPVEDERSAEFLEVFYDALEPGGISPSQALAEARQVHASQHSSPYSWGPFTLLGLA